MKPAPKYLTVKEAEQHLRATYGRSFKRHLPAVRRMPVRVQLRTLRLAIGNPSQIEVEQLAQLPRGKYWRIENGYDEPTPEERTRLAFVFRVKLAGFDSDKELGVAIGDEGRPISASQLSAWFSRQPRHREPADLALRTASPFRVSALARAGGSHRRSRRQGLDRVEQEGRMNRMAVDSSLIASAGHDGDAMEVELASGQVYRYEGISREQYDAFMASDSKGKYFNGVIKGACASCTRVDRHEH